MSARLEQHLARLRERFEAEVDHPLPWAAVEVMARSEDCRTTAYLCPAGVPTIGWGTTRGVKLGMTWTPSRCDEVCLVELAQRAAVVQRLVTRPCSRNELGAMTSLHYNIGSDGFAKSTVLRQHNAGNANAAARAFGLWNKARDPKTGQLVELRGLTARRAAEAALYLRPEVDTPREPMPQAVAHESSLAASPIARSGAVTVGAGALTAVATVTEQIEATSTTLSTTVASMKALAVQAAEFVGVPPGLLFGAALAYAGWVVVKWRRAQREQGYA